MKITAENLPKKIKITIEGLIKSPRDSEAIKNKIGDSFSLDPDKEIEIHVKDSFIITSSVIGFLIKFIQKDNMKLSLFVYNDELYNLLDEMCLLETLNVRKAV